MNFTDFKNAICNRPTTAEALTTVGKVKQAFHNPRFKWRTITGLAEESNIPEDTVAIVLMSFIDTHDVITKKLPDENGRKMYAFRGHERDEDFDETAETEETTAPAVSTDPTHTGLLYKRISYNRFITTSSEFENAVTSGEKIRPSKLPAMVSLFIVDECYKVEVDGNPVFVVKAGDEYFKFVIA